MTTRKFKTRRIEIEYRDLNWVNSFRETTLTSNPEAKGFYFESEIMYDSAMIFLVYSTYETKIEENERIEQEERIAKSRTLRDYDQYLKLKAKFESE